MVCLTKRQREIVAARRGIKVIVLRKRMKYDRNLLVKGEEVVKPAEIRAGAL